MASARVLTAVAATVVALLATACGSAVGTGGAPSGSSAGSTVSVKNADYGSHCPPPRWQSDSGTRIGVADISTLVVCPQPFPDWRGRGVRLARGQPGFTALLQQIAKPSETRKPNQICPMFALPQEHVLASAGGSWYVVDLPTDACGHYRASLLSLLNRLRS